MHHNTRTSAPAGGFLVGRSVVRVLVVALVSMVTTFGIIASTPAVAAPASLAGSPGGLKYGPAVGWSYDFGVKFLGGVKCVASSYWVVPAGATVGDDGTWGGTPPLIRTKGSCADHGLPTPGFDQFGDHSTGSLVFNGDRVDGSGGCQLSGTVMKSPGGDTFDLNLDAGLGLAGALGVHSCQVTQVCLSLHMTSVFWDADKGPACVQVDLGEPPTGAGDSGGACPALSNVAVSWKPRPYEYNAAVIVFSYLITLTNPDTKLHTVKIYGTTNHGAQGQLDTTIDVQPGQTLTDYEMKTNNGPGPNGENVANGYELAVVDSTGLPATAPDGNGIYTIPSTYSSGSDVGQGFNGITDVARCRFFVGDAIADPALVGAEFAKPYGSVGGGVPSGEPSAPPPIADPGQQSGGCTFSFGDPSTWASAGICALVSLISKVVDVLGSVLGVLGNILGSIAGLVVSLVTQLGQLLKTLFVPHPDSYDWQGFVTQVKDRPPGSVVIGLGASVTGFVGAFSSAGDCGTLADFSNDQVHAPITCSAIRSLPGFAGAYAIMTACLVLTTAFGCFKLVAASTGGNS